MKIISLHYHELMEKIKEHYLINNGYILDKILVKFKETIGTVKFDDTKILIHADTKLPDYITFTKKYF